MTIELGEQLPNTNKEGTTFKPLKAFYQLKTLVKGHLVEGIHQGRFESKTKPGYFYHILKAKDDESYAYGTCQALDDRIKEIKDKEAELDSKIYAQFSFNGRVPSKKNPAMTYYNFSNPTMFPVKGTKAADKSVGTVETTSDDIPF